MIEIASLGVLLLLLLVLWLVVGPIVAMSKASSATRRCESLRKDLRDLAERQRGLEQQLRMLRAGAPQAVPAAPAAPAQPAPVPQEVPAAVEARREAGPAAEALPPPLPAADRRTAPAPMWDRAPAAVPAGAAEPLPPVGPAAEDVAGDEPVAAGEAFSLERFMGVKMFAWLGGLAMFIGVILFVKYAFENNLISKEVRTALGFITGAGLLAGGVVMQRMEPYRVLSHAFCATGVLILYGVSFAAHAIYHFAAFGLVPTFLLMAMITLAAFLIAVRMNALVVAVLGMLGGFLTPVLLSTGRDQVFGLFGYIALLDIGLLAVARHGSWRFLASCAAAGTVLMQMGWMEQFFVAGRYDEGARVWIPMGILIFFAGLFLAGGCWRRRKEPLEAYGAGAVLGLAGMATFFSFWMLDFPAVAQRYGELYGFIAVIQCVIIAVALLRVSWAGVQWIGTAVVFMHLLGWSRQYLAADNLTGALVWYLLFGALHAVVPVVAARRMPAAGWSAHVKVAPWVGPLALLMMLLPVWRFTPASLVVWPAVFAGNFLILGLAVVTRRVVPVMVALFVTMVVLATGLYRLPDDTDLLPLLLAMILLFAGIFALAGRYFMRRLPAGPVDYDAEAARMLPVLAGLLPYGLLLLAVSRLAIANPAPVFGTALVLAALLGGLALLANHGALVLTALLATAAVEGMWHVEHFKVEAPWLGLGWYVGFHLLFTAFPFVFRKQCASMVSPWIASALSGVAHYALVYPAIKLAFPNPMMGLVPAAFAVPALAALAMVVRHPAADPRLQRSRLAWFGGVALLFITLVVPVQTERQWITVSWGIEGALLLWLYRRVSHPGLQLTGLALLGVAFVRLTLNPAVFLDYPRSGTPVFNWHLYVYGAVAAAHLLGARWLAEPVPWVAKYHPRGVLTAMGGVLCFVLLNIEIADYFTAPGARFIVFAFGGNFARDMTYSIAWGLFALGLLGLGIWRRSPHARYAAVGLLGATLLKLFVHDLAAIGNVFRIGALVGVAIIAFVASFLYQRFFDRSNTPR